MGARWTGTAPVGGGVGAEARRCHGGQFGGRDGGGGRRNTPPFAVEAVLVSASTRVWPFLDHLQRATKKMISNSMPETRPG